MSVVLCASWLGVGVMMLMTEGGVVLVSPCFVDLADVNVMEASEG